MQSYSPASELSLLSSSSVREKMGFFIFSSSATSFAFRLLKLLAMASLAFVCRTLTRKKKVSTGKLGWLIMMTIPYQVEGSEGLNIKLSHWSFPHKSDINRERIEGLSPVVLSAVSYLLVWSVVVLIGPHELPHSRNQEEVTYLIITEPDLVVLNREGENMVYNFLSFSVLLRRREGLSWMYWWEFSG